MPAACAACASQDLEQPDRALCEACHRNLAVRSAGCHRCGEPLTPDGRCTASHEPLRHISRLSAPYRFAGTGGRLVRRFKLDGNASAGCYLARAMADCLRSQAGLGRPVVVSVPLHKHRRRRRGFDQAEWLARRIAARLGLRRGDGVLVRCRATRPQGDVRVLSRVQNVRGAFRVRAPEAIRGRPVVLVDDVFTTGATARTCARLLRDAGAVSVRILVACRS